MEENKRRDVFGDKLVSANPAVIPTISGATFNNFPDNAMAKPAMTMTMSSRKRVRLAMTPSTNAKINPTRSEPARCHDTPNVASHAVPCDWPDVHAASNALMTMTSTRSFRTTMAKLVCANGPLACVSRRMATTTAGLLALINAVNTAIRNQRSVGVRCANNGTAPATTTSNTHTQSATPTDSKASILQMREPAVRKNGIFNSLPAIRPIKLTASACTNSK